MDMEHRVEALEREIKELRRLVDHGRDQLSVHAKNTEGLLSREKSNTVAVTKSKPAPKPEKKAS